jgi:hypothetical protein
MGASVLPLMHAKTFRADLNTRHAPISQHRSIIPKVGGTAVVSTHSRVMVMCALVQKVTKARMVCAKILMLVWLRHVGRTPFVLMLQRQLEKDQMLEHAFVPHHDRCRGAHAFVPPVAQVMLMGLPHARILMHVHSFRAPLMLRALISQPQFQLALMDERAHAQQGFKVMAKLVIAPVPVEQFVMVSSA